MEIYQVNLQNIRLYAYHGFFPEERILGNWYQINLKVTVDVRNGIKDDLKQTLDYGSLYLICKEVMVEPVDLLETVVAKLVDKIRMISKEIVEIDLELFKVNPPLGQSSGKSSISVLLKY